ncbi:bacterioferritin [Microtetraspora malaysiensis]|uniref:Bacterioferritin n=1 Tax=Microtetraspora malaysiensis TaxID=161358 RepID=A0ABW6SHH9_9ACTN
MQGDKDIIALLNEQLTSELTAINQYFLHAKMQENWGYTKLAEYTRHESFDEMRHAERLTDRILFLDGLPNYQKLNTLHIGQTVKEQLQADLALEYSVVKRLKPGIAFMRERGDITSANIFEDILKDEEMHIDYLETELGLYESLGEQLYLQRYAEPPSSSS